MAGSPTQDQPEDSRQLSQKPDLWRSKLHDERVRCGNICGDILQSIGQTPSRSIVYAAGVCRTERNKELWRWEVGGRGGEGGAGAGEGWRKVDLKRRIQPSASLGVRNDGGELGSGSRIVQCCVLQVVSHPLKSL